MPVATTCEDRSGPKSRKIKFKNTGLIQPCEPTFERKQNREHACIFPNLRKFKHSLAYLKDVRSY